MIPYIHIAPIRLGPFTLHPFGILVALGVWVGMTLAARRGRLLGFDGRQLSSFIAFVLVGGFVGGHVLDELFYHPTDIATVIDGHLVWTRPWSLLMLWAGLSSFGGFIGALCGAFLWKFYELKPMIGLGPIELRWLRRRSKSGTIIPFCDLLLSVFPIAWMFGRAGCSVVHDHPGSIAPARAWFAVSYPESVPVFHGPVDLIRGGVPRYDLGLLELIFTILLAAVIVVTWRRRLPTGSYIVILSLAYAPVRFALDFLRIREGETADPRYGSLTPAQWACIVLFVFGLVMLGFLRTTRGRALSAGR
jgi:phosphatidylglycerol:prolipoprotein diacylglycerol transferase